MSNVFLILKKYIFQVFNFWGNIWRVNPQKNIEEKFFIGENMLPPGFKYPNDYINFVNSEIPDYYPWHIINNHLEFRFKGMQQRYPKRTMVPFARRGDNDDVACFDAALASDNPPVLIIHDFASEGWEERGKLDNFLAWVELAKEEASEWKQSQ